MSSDCRLNVFALPGLIPAEVLPESVTVIVDILRATTTINHAMAAGATCVIPCLTTDDAMSLRESRLQHNLDEQILLGGERYGKRIDGFDLGNSPGDYLPETVGGKTIIFTTTNGTRAIFTAQLAQHIIFGCFNNLTAIAFQLIQFRQINIVCAGTDKQYTEEDILFAGALVDRLCRISHHSYSINTQAIAAQYLWEQQFPLAKRTGKEPIHPENLAQVLRLSRGGKNLMQIGLGKDIIIASNIDSLNTVPFFDFKTGMILLAIKNVPNCNNQ